MLRVSAEGAATAIVLAVHARTDQAATAGFLQTAMTLPYILSGPVIGHAMDRTPRPRGLALVLTAGYGIAIGLLLLTAGDAPLGFALMIAAVVGCTEPIVVALTSLLPRFVVAERLTRAYGLEASSYNLAAIAGPGLAAGFAAWLGGGGAGIPIVVCAFLGLLALPLLPFRAPTRANRTVHTKQPAQATEATTKADQSAQPEATAQPEAAAPAEQAAAPEGAALPEAAAPAERGVPGERGTSAELTSPAERISPAERVAEAERVAPAEPVSRAEVAPQDEVTAPAEPTSPAEVAPPAGSGPSTGAASVGRGVAGGSGGGGVVLARGVVDVVVGGLTVLVDNRVLRALTAATTLAWLGFGGIAVTAVLLADRIGAAPSAGGQLLATMAVGSLIGSLVCARWLSSRHAETVMLAGLAAFGTALGSLALAPSLPWAMLGFLLAGISEGPVFAATLTLRQRESPPERLGQVNTTGGSLKIGASAVGAALTATFADRIGPVGLVLAIAACQFAGLALGLVILRARRSRL
ncbi:hypothetical protein GCM10010411_60280 [Actinomadura fulvescens]|uniref:Major facilitator superfamily (MFS) profile domain-containing protein n=1 Tax=Actinomadura fulvescens TaxID=46160 RepID=A0ABN3Q522_9ACTN